MKQDEKTPNWPMHGVAEADVGHAAAVLSGVILSKQEYPFSPYQQDIYTLASDIYVRTYAALQDSVLQESAILPCKASVA